MWWTAILNIVNGFLAVLDKTLSAIHDAQERKAGRDEAELEQAKQTLSDQEKANEIEARPPVTDRGTLLGKLRRPGGPK